MLTEPHILAAFLYQQLGEQMPEPVLDADGELDVAADNAALEAWSAQSDPFSADHSRLEQFILCTEQMLNNLTDNEYDESEPLAPQYMSIVYEAGKETFDHDKTQLRTYFAWLYLVVFQRPDGPRWGDFIDIYGVDNFVKLVRERFGVLINGS
jgi:lysyl-tRNA synthetase class I